MLLIYIGRSSRARRMREFRAKVKASGQKVQFRSPVAGKKRKLEALEAAAGIDGAKRSLLYDEILKDA